MALKHFLALALVLLAGCRSTLVEKMEDEYAPVMASPVEGRPFVGIVVPRESPQDAIGLKVERILSEGPAEAAGLRPGDEIRLVNKLPVRSAHDLDQIMRGLSSSPAKGYEVTVATNGEERVVHLAPLPWTDRLGALRGAFRRIARSNDVTFALPLLFAYEHMVVSAESYLAWTGIAITEPIDYYRDVAFVDLFGVFDFFRTEHTCLSGASRLTIFVRLYTSTSDEVPTRATGEDKLEVF